jgi:hypothetical protein
MPSSSEFTDEPGNPDSLGDAIFGITVAAISNADLGSESLSTIPSTIEEGATGRQQSPEEPQAATDPSARKGTLHTAITIAGK